MMQAMMPNILAMIGSLIGQPSLGWVVHLVVSAVIGAIFGFGLGTYAQTRTLAITWALAIGLGAAYGFVWWILAAFHHADHAGPKVLSWRTHSPSRMSWL
jgi:hypothetical protein